MNCSGGNFSNREDCAKEEKGEQHHQREINQNCHLSLDLGEKVGEKKTKFPYR